MENNLDTQGDYYLRGVMQTATDPIIPISIPINPQEEDLTRGKLQSFFKERMNVDESTASDLTDGVMQNISFRDAMGGRGLALQPVEYGNQHVGVVLQPHAANNGFDFKQTLLGVNSIISSLPGKSEEWAEGAGVHEGRHGTKGNREMANILDKEIDADPVSYTHLTLPTIYSV